MVKEKREQYSDEAELFSFAAAQNPYVDIDRAYRSAKYIQARPDYSNGLLTKLAKMLVYIEENELTGSLDSLSDYISTHLNGYQFIQDPTESSNNWIMNLIQKRIPSFYRTKSAQAAQNFCYIDDWSITGSQVLSIFRNFSNSVRVFVGLFQVDNPSLEQSLITKGIYQYYINPHRMKTAGKVLTDVEIGFLSRLERQFIGYQGLDRSFVLGSSFWNIPDNWPHMFCHPNSLLHFVSKPDFDRTVKPKIYSDLSY